MVEQDPVLLRHLQTLQTLLAKTDPNAWLVGGFLRDWLLNRPTRDVDLALPEGARKAAERMAREVEGALVTLEEEREIYRVISPDGFQFDFAKFKGSDIQADLSARDFTINAMAVKLDLARWDALETGLLDPHGGRRDLNNKTIRQVSPAVYTEDPLRMLRAFRIAAQLQFQIESETASAIRAHAARIREPAAERTREEILLLLESPNAHPTILQADEAGLLSPIFPEIDPNRTCALHYYPGKGVWGHSTDGLKRLEWIFSHLDAEFPEDHEKMVPILFEIGGDTEGHSRAALLKLAILLHDVGKASTAKEMEGRMRFFMHDEIGARMSKDAARRLKFSSDATQTLSNLVLHHMRPGGMAHNPTLTDRAKYRFFRDLGQNAVPMLIVSLADRYSYLTDQEMGQKTDLHERSTKEIVRWYYQKELEQQAKKPKLLNGHILMEKFGLPPGKRIGEILKDVEEAAALGEISTLEEALALADRLLKNEKQSD